MPDDQAESLNYSLKQNMKMKKILIALVKFYRKHISPHLPAMCKYYPTCSAYAIEAIEVHGAFKGSVLAVLRILRCNELFPGGYDPVPPKKEKHKKDN